MASKTHHAIRNSRKRKASIFPRILVLFHVLHESYVANVTSGVLGVVTTVFYPSTRIPVHQNENQKTETSFLWLPVQKAAVESESFCMID